MEDRRTSDPLLIEVLSLTRSNQDAMIQLDRRLTAHMNIEERIVKETNDALYKITKDVEAVSSLLKAFPKKHDGSIDVEGHLDDHLTRMTQARASKKWWNDLRDDLAANAVKAAIVFILLLIALGAKEWVLDKVVGTKHDSTTIGANK
jgi:hypothetical protein